MASTTVHYEVFGEGRPFLLGRQDHIVGYRDQWRIVEQHPRATFAVLDCAGHGLVGIEQVEVCHALIDGWLDRVEQSERV